MAMELKRKKNLCIVLAILALLFATLSRAVGERREGNATCNGSIADCYAEAEFFMDSEITRRYLQSEPKYISYGALKKTNPARGDPQPGGPYGRGCQKFYGCKGGS